MDGLTEKFQQRFQYRVGPPFLQNFNDFFKLLGKKYDIVVKDSVKSMSLLAPFISFAMLVLVSSIVGTSLFFNVSFGGDLVIMYLLMIFSVMVVLGGSASGNVYSSLGAGREIKLLLADELAFILVLLVPIIKSGYQIDIL